MPIFSAGREFLGRGPLHFVIVVFLLLFVPVSFIVSPCTASAGQAALAWSAPFSNTDGTPLTDLAGYKIYYGTSSRSYSSNINVGNLTTSTVSNLPDGTYYFAVTAYDAAGRESGYSNEVSKTLRTVQPDTLTVNRLGSGSGTVTSSPSGINCGTGCSAAYNQGTIVTLTASPATGSTFTGWSGGGCTGNGTCSLSLTANTAVTATFANNTTPSTAYTITASAGSGGTITPSGAVATNSGANKAFTIAPNTGYRITGVTVDGVSVGAVSSYTFNNVTANHRITASFALVSTSNSTYTISAKAGAGGSISPSGRTNVRQGSGQVFTITPKAGHRIVDVKVDGASVGAVGTYAFTNVTSNHKIAASFQ